ncbi:MAG: hypothetical protein EAZ97_07240 [Bacteroidetes bacterium]|nr:MAG: hypothetical protein EAZ97_07240 [Bacteroidota bacterium]
MCVTVENSVLTSTYIGSWEIMHPEYGYRHVLAYQNMPQNLSNLPNCMLLPIQSKQELTPENIVDTSNCPDFLSKMIEDRLPKMRGIMPSNSENYVMEMGIYHIAILNNVSKEALKETLKNIPSHKNPNISEEFMDFFRKTYSKFPLLLCCFNNQDISKASPIMVHYVPLRPNILMFNTLESHGTVPDLNEEMQLTQKILVGSFQNSHPIFHENKWQNYELKIDEKTMNEQILPFLPKFGLAHNLSEGYISPFYNEEDDDLYYEYEKYHSPAFNGDVLFDIGENARYRYYYGILK